MSGWGVLLFPPSVVALVIGVCIGVWGWIGSRVRRSRSIAILSDRFARGEIDADEYRARVEVLARRAPARAGVRVAAVALVVAGLAGLGTAVASLPGAFARVGEAMRDGENSSSSTRPAVAAPGKGITVTASDFEFSPRKIRVRAGEPVEVRFHNAGGMFHTLTMESEDFELEAGSGESERGVLVLHNPGTYDFECDVLGHSLAGMTGTIEVVES